MSGSELGAAIGLRKDQISKIESGKRRLDVGELPGIAAALGVTARHLVGQPERSGLAVAARLAVGTGPEATRAARRRARHLLGIDDLLRQITGMPDARPSATGEAVLRQARSEFSARPTARATAQSRGPGWPNSPGENWISAATPSATSPPWSNSTSPSTWRCPRSARRPTASVSTGSSSPAATFRTVTCGSPWRTNWRTTCWTISERAVVALMEHFGVSRAALIYQLNVIGLLDFETGQRLKEKPVHALVARHRDVAPTKAATGPEDDITL
ncbi:helix-turn-helix transcriptional regulator [Allokutzneria sp. A3M-2-11 16]|nr:helix-turn-helix transcriptional regulator [Allokutzneria sp. A3M-2-11 16]